MIVDRGNRMLRAFFRTEAGSTVVLLAATVLAMLWANSPWGDTYESFWHTSMGLSFGSAEFSLDLRHWVNDGLMTIFFFAIGLEISYEVRQGQLRDRRLIAVPAVAALGGMIVPAAVYLAFNAGGPGAGGWGVPIATDTAFALGLLAVVGARCPDPLRAFLLTLAIVDDVLAMMIIAIFYTAHLSIPALVTAAVLLVAIMTLRWLKIWRAPAYVILGFALWVATLESGVHPTLVGIALGVLVIVYAPSDHKLMRAGEAVQQFTNDPSASAARDAARSVKQAVSVNERLQLLLHPWTSYVIVPIFALANAGVRLDSETLREALTSPIALGVALGLLVGKFVGISIGTWLPLRFGWGVLPGNLVWGRSCSAARRCPASASPWRCSSWIWPSTIRTSWPWPRSASWPGRSCRRWPGGSSSSSPGIAAACAPRRTRCPRRSCRRCCRSPSARATTCAARPTPP